MSTNVYAKTTGFIGANKNTSKALKGNIPPKTSFPWKHESQLDQLSLRLKPGTIENRNDLALKYLIENSDEDSFKYAFNQSLCPHFF
jgi:hypothetical protein